ncbi:hypothetical protein RJ639_016525, partial [Escallonia herrerae]
MEKLRSVIPETLKRAISESTPDELSSTCSSLLDFFQHLPLFHQHRHTLLTRLDGIVRDLTDMETALRRKNRDAALEWKRKGNDCLCLVNLGLLINVLFYSLALRIAPTDVDEMGKDLVATLYKMGLQLECLRDSNRALAICPSYGKAWYRRGKANASLGNYEDAYCDLNLARNMELSLGGKKQIERELNIIKDQPKGKSSSFEEATEKRLEFSGWVQFSPNNSHLNYFFVLAVTAGNGSIDRCTASFFNPYRRTLSCEPGIRISAGLLVILNGVLVSQIILKHCRDTHCHFCLNELPVDIVPCSSCSIPLYCSQQCQVEAGGRKMGNYLDNYGLGVHVSDDLQKYSRDVIVASISGPEIERIAAHKHECQGAHWPAVLPSEVVLAGRVLVRSMGQQRHFSSVSSLIEDLDLCHNYVQLPLDTRVEMHIHSIILLQCLQHPCGFQLLINGVYISQCVILLAQIRVNCMAIVRMKSSNVNKPVDQSGLSSSAGVSSMEQVRVGQAIYSAGSFLTILVGQTSMHISFHVPSLYGQQNLLSQGIRWSCLMLGQLDCKVRQNLLEDQYSFRCQCAGCSELNFSDLVLNAFRCVKPNCFGVVLDSCIAMYEKQKVNPFRDLQTTCSSEPQIIEKLYGLDHIVVGNELVKLASVKLSSGDPAAVDNINRIRSISNHLGLLNVDHIFRVSQILSLKSSFCLHNNRTNTRASSGALTKKWLRLHRHHTALLGDLAIETGFSHRRIFSSSLVFGRVCDLSTFGLDRGTGDAGCGFLRVGVVPAEVVPAGALAGDIPVALGDGVDGHDLRAAGTGDALDEAFLTTA